MTKEEERIRDRNLVTLKQALWFFETFGGNGYEEIDFRISDWGNPDALPPIWYTSDDNVYLNGNYYKREIPNAEWVFMMLYVCTRIKEHRYGPYDIYRYPKGEKKKEADTNQVGYCLLLRWKDGELMG